MIKGWCKILINSISNRSSFVIKDLKCFHSKKRNPVQDKKKDTSKNNSANESKTKKRKNIIDTFLQYIINKLPIKEISIILPIINTILFTGYLCVDNKNLLKVVYDPVLANFINIGQIRFLINNSLLYFLGYYIEITMGSVILLKIIILSLIQGIILCNIAKKKHGKFYYNGNDAIIQGMAFTLLLKSPLEKMQNLIPIFPIPLRAFTVFLLMILYDLYKNNVPACGGLGTGLILASKIL